MRSPFILKDPISDSDQTINVWATGVPTLNEGYELYWHQQGKYFFWTVAIASMALATLFLYKVLSEEDEISLVPLVVISFLIASGPWLAYLSFGFLLPRRAIKRSRELATGIFQERSAQLTDQSIRLATDDGASVLNWQAFESYKQTPNTMTLISQRVGVIVFTRSTFSIEDDWLKFVAWIENHLKPYTLFAR
jgi:hypothetical protein